MPDTIRTIPELLALYADNVTGDISPQDGRDFIVSALGVYGGISVVGGAAAQAGIGTVPVQLVGFDTNDPSAGTIPDQANDDIEVDVDGVYLGVFQISFSGSNNTKFTFEYYVDGVASGFAQARRLGSGGDIGGASMFFLANGTKGQKVTIRVNADSAGKNLTAEDMQLILVRVG